MRCSWTTAATVVVAGLGACRPGAAQEAQVPREVVVPLELTPTTRKAIPLNQDHIALADGEGRVRRPVPVVLEVTTYSGTVLHIVGGRAKWGVPPGRLYELRSTETDVPYSWALWSPLVLGWFRLFSTQGGDNYLAWVDASTVVFAEVSKPRDRCLAWAQHFSGEPPPGATRTPVRQLVPEARTWGVNALYFDIIVRSIDKDDDGNWVVRISPPDSDEVFTLVGKDGKWRRE